MRYLRWEEYKPMLDAQIEMSAEKTIRVKGKDTGRVRHSFLPKRDAYVHPIRDIAGNCGAVNGTPLVSPGDHARFFCESLPLAFRKPAPVPDVPTLRLRATEARKSLRKLTSQFGG
jgi:hypothetical protein